MCCEFYFCVNFFIPKRQCVRGFFFLFLIFLDAHHIEVKLLNRLVDIFARMVLT